MQTDINPVFKKSLKPIKRTTDLSVFFLIYIKYTRGACKITWKCALSQSYLNRQFSLALEKDATCVFALLTMI